MYFRTDMNSEIATGHVMRCLAIAEGFKKKGENSTFLLSDDTAVSLIKSRGFDTVVLNTMWNDMDKELPVLADYIRKQQVRQMIVDSYSATEYYLRELNQLTSVVYIDDLREGVYDVDILLAFSMGENSEAFYSQYYNNKHTRLLVGSQYVPLREEFQNVGEKEHSAIYDVMITTGGTDTYNVAGRLMERFREVYPELGLVVLSPKISESMSDDKLTIIPRSNQMASLMTSSRVVISAAGGTLFELCACRVPVVAFSFADNQVAFAKKMHKLGAAVYAGDARSNERIIEDIVEQTSGLLNDRAYCETMVEKMAAITDGYGVDRIVEEVMFYGKTASTMNV